jgi:hypothetical protein
MMARVYVSSTIADLKRERRAVSEWLVAAQHQVSHSYRPDSDTVRDSCLEDVDSCDLFVLILGHRYGYQPSGPNQDSLSITQLEYRRAGLAHKPRIALLRTSIPDVGLSDLEVPERAALVLAFRAEVAREVRPSEFHDEGGLMRALSTGIQAELAKLDERSQPLRPADSSPVLKLAPRPTMLAGREELLALLDDRLTSDEETGPQAVTLCGLGGAGKTSVSVEYAHRHLDDVGIAWQLPAEDATVLAAGFTELAAQRWRRWPGPRPGSGNSLGAGLLSGAVVADLRQRLWPGADTAVLASCRERQGTDHQSKRDLAARSDGGGPGSRYRGLGHVPDEPGR